MILITVFLLAGPGLLAWFVEGDTGLKDWRDMITAFAKWILNNYLIISVMYLIIHLRYDNVKASFTTQFMDDIWNTIYDVDFVGKYGLMTAGLAVILGLVERLVVPVVREKLEERFSHAEK